MPNMLPVARTAFYCCALRAADAESARPVCGDAFAARFLDDDTLKELKPALQIHGPAASNVARHRLIDDIVRDALGKDPSRRVLLLGAGLDTRAFRISGGRWWELDDPSLLAFKEERLPARSAPNPLVRIPVSFQTENVADHLAALGGDDEALAILEGVSMYLPEHVIRDLATGVRTHLPRATLVADLMSPAFRRRFGAALHRELNRLGAHFAGGDRHPRLAIEAAGYHLQRVTSIVGRARDAGTIRIPRWLLSTLLRELRDGYAVHVFEPAGPRRTPDA
jgi:methyltransferase (TIGR00027 family)